MLIASRGDMLANIEICLPSAGSTLLEPSVGKFLFD